MKTKTFAVDASLLEELGERLIGRSPIALGELVKNSYDADAATCQIELATDHIVVADDGTGMSMEDFVNNWMRIGTTHKIDKRTSPNGRSLTGSKGIGRLSVQFLADEMILETTSATDPGHTLYVEVDWSTVKRGQDLSTVTVKYAIRPGIPVLPGGSHTGTRITLRKLKNEWDAPALDSLGREVWMLRSPFRRRSRPSKKKRPEEFIVEVDAPAIAGAKESFDRARRAVLESWKARITGTLRNGRTGGRATLEVEFTSGYPERSNKAVKYRESIRFPVRKTDTAAKPLVDNVTFEILVFKTKGKQTDRIAVADVRDYLAEFGNVSVYDAGFRLPYYGSGRVASGQDWLSIAIDQGRRLNASELLPPHLRAQNRYMQDLPAPGRIFGAVEINTNHERVAAGRDKKSSKSEWLRIQSGRDRLEDNAAFTQLRDLVRVSLDFYASRHRLRSLQAVERERSSEQPSRKYARLVIALDANEKRLPTAVYRELRREAIDAQKASSAEETALDRRAALLAPLASAGMVALALSHELARETRLLETVSRRLRALGKEHALQELAAMAEEFDTSRRRLDGLRDLFAPLVSYQQEPSLLRLKVRPVAGQIVEGMRALTPGVKYDLSDIPSDLLFPPGLLGDWFAVLQNILANAWNAMLDSPKAVVQMSGGRESRGVEWLRISDTGAGLGVPLAEAEKLFEPFERQLVISEDKKSIALGGQGLGLAIVRMIAGRRLAQVRFVEPVNDQFATTLELRWKGEPR